MQCANHLLALLSPVFSFVEYHAEGRMIVKGRFQPHISMLGVSIDQMKDIAHERQLLFVWHSSSGDELYVKVSK